MKRTDAVGADLPGLVFRAAIFAKVRLENEQPHAFAWLKAGAGNGGFAARVIISVVGSDDGKDLRAQGFGRSQGEHQAGGQNLYRATFHMRPPDSFSQLNENLK
jgi:hypothetical protein